MATDTFSIEVNGQRVKAHTGELLLTTLRRAGIKVPTLCHDQRLTPYGGCRLCLVARRDSGSGLIAACHTPVQPRMVIETDSADVVEACRRQLQLLMLNHRMECPVCERSGDCRLQDLAYEYGVVEEHTRFDRVLHPRDEASPIIVRDPEKCVVCARCVRLCDEVQGVAEIGIRDRGIKSAVSTAGGRPLDCEFCGQCVNACPVGALVAIPTNPSVPVWYRDANTTTCSYCSCGCQLTVESYDGQVQRVYSAVENSPNDGKLCAKGWQGWDAATNPERIDKPLVRRNGELVKVSWAEALDAVVEGRRRASGDGKAVVGLATPRLTNEDAYLFQRLFRTAFQSPHVGPGSAAGVSALVEGTGTALGIYRPTATFEDLAAAEVVLVLRADPTRTHPLVKTELVQGARQRRQKIILAHALSGGMERHASRYLPLLPGSEATLLLGLAAELARRALDKPRHRAATGFDAFKESLESYGAEAVAEATGLDAEEIVETARILADASSVVAVVPTGNGIPGDEAEVVRRACELLILLGKAEGPGNGILVLGEKANVFGLVESGLHPALLPGGRDATSTAERKLCADTWNSAIPEEPGWSMAEALKASTSGEIGLLYLVGVDPLGTGFGDSIPHDAIEQASFVVVQDPFLTKTAAVADVVLPVTMLGERMGHFTVADGTQRELRRAVPAPEGIPQDGQIFAELARRSGASVVTGPALRTEMRLLVRDLHRAAPRPAFSAPGPVSSIPVQERRFFLDLSPHLFHSGNTTLRSSNLKKLRSPVALRLAPGDAEMLGIKDGTMVRVVAGETKWLLRARLDAMVRRGTVAALQHSLETRERRTASTDQAMQWVSVEPV